MAKITRRQLLGTAAGTLLLSVSTVSLGAESAQFVAVRVWPADAYTRVTLESTLPLQFNYFHLTEPHRLVIDISGAQLNEVLRTLPAKVLERDPYITGVRVAQNRTDVIRIVFDLKAPVSPQLFTLTPVADFQNRLVIDLYPVLSPARAEEDPLMALLRDYRQGKLGQSVPPDKPPEAARDLLAEKIEELMNEEGTPTQIEIAPLPEPPKRSGRRKIVVVLDPGHGGEDPGAVGHGLMEKNVVLQIARVCKSELEKLGYLVHMTRNEDVFIPLQVRVKMAQRLRADLFISIHADAFTSPSARGTGVYALSRKGATGAAARYLASTQNAADAIGGVPKVGDRHIDSTLFDLTQTATIKDSLRVGKLVLNELGKINKLHKGHVEQAAFAVLKAPDIPSILVESAFISNPQEAKLLANAQFRSKVALAIAQGTHHYFRQGAALARR